MVLVRKGKEGLVPFVGCLVSPRWQYQFSDAHHAVVKLGSATTKEGEEEGGDVKGRRGGDRRNELSGKEEWERHTRVIWYYYISIRSGLPGRSDWHQRWRLLIVVVLMYICNSPVNLNKQQHKQGDNSKREREGTKERGHTILRNITHDLQRFKLLLHLR